MPFRTNQPSTKCRLIFRHLPSVIPEEVDKDEEDDNGNNDNDDNKEEETAEDDAETTLPHPNKATAFITVEHPTTNTTK